MIDAGVAELATGNIAALGNAWASVSAAVDTKYQILGISGGCSSVSCTIDLEIDGKIRQRYFTHASGGAVSEWWGELGPIAGANSSIAVHTDTSASQAHHCSANLMYRVVLV